MVQSNEQLAEMLKSNKEWSRAIVFDHTAKVIASTFEADPAEIDAFLSIFDDRDTTVGEGALLCGHHFDIHRFYDRLIYGRRGDSERGEGIAFCRTKSSTSGEYIYAVITYTFPTISARAVPMLQKLCDDHVAVL